MASRTRDYRQHLGGWVEFVADFKAAEQAPLRRQLLEVSASPAPGKATATAATPGKAAAAAPGTAKAPAPAPGNATAAAAATAPGEATATATVTAKDTVASAQAVPSSKVAAASVSSVSNNVDDFWGEALANAKPGYELIDKTNTKYKEEEADTGDSLHNNDSSNQDDPATYGLPLEKGGRLRIALFEPQMY